jgi:hypothetical protein
MPRSGAVLAGAGVAVVVGLAAEAAGAGAEELGDCCEHAAQAQATAAARISVERGMGYFPVGKARMMHQTGPGFRCRKCRVLAFPDLPRRPRASQSKDGWRFEFAA